MGDTKMQPAGEFRNAHEAPDEGVFYTAAFGLRISRELGVVRSMVADNTYPTGDSATPAAAMIHDKNAALRKSAETLAHAAGEALNDDTDIIEFVVSRAAELGVPEPDLTDYRPA